MESNDYFNEIMVVKRTGRVVAASADAAVIKRILTDGPSQQALAARGPTISEPFRSKDGNIIVLMTYPIVNARGEYFGYLGGTIHLHENNVLNEIFGGSAVNESGTYTYVVDRSGRILYHPDRDRLGENVSANAAVRKVMKGQHGYEEVTNTKGDVFLAGYTSVEENGWGIVVQTPADEIRTQTFQIIVKEIVYTLPIFLLLLLVTIILARKLAAPIALLAETAERITAGKPVESLPHHAVFTYEANQLYQTVLLAMEKLQKRAEHLRNEANTDPLTGLPNRRALDALVAAWIHEKKPFSLVAIDIDFFKQVNDAYGHQIGDQVLQYLADVMRANSRKGDYCSRYGGEEFIILLPNTPCDEAFQMIERIRTTLEQNNSPTGQPITVSCGVASFPDHATTAHELLERADQALYAAKRQGRNRTVVYGRQNETDDKLN